MTVIRISDSAPTFQVNSSDISGNTFTGALSYLGAAVFNLDTGLWYKIDGTGQLVAYTIPVSFSGTVTTSGLTDAQLRATPVPQVLTAGTAYVGTTGGNTAEIDVVPTLTVHATYVSGDYVGTSATAMVFSGASRVNNFTGTILSAVLVDYALQSVACELWLFDTAVTPPADSAAWTLSDADCARCIGVIPFSTYYASAANSVSFAQGVGIGFKTLSASTNIYGCLVTRGAPTYASGDLTVRLTILQD